eukprot:scaffold206328_cov69-Attheya_sp.AAC.1
MFCFRPCKKRDSPLPKASKREWENWSRNLRYLPPKSGKYMFAPRTQAELIKVLSDARKQNVKVRVSGQRHSQPPLVIHDNTVSGRSNKPDIFLIDLSYYADLENGQRFEILKNNQCRVNAGVREDELDAFLQSNNLALQTVTAGGIFSIGGMCANDVHGGSVAA